MLWLGPQLVRREWGLRSATASLAVGRLQSRTRDDALNARRLADAIARLEPVKDASRTRVLVAYGALASASGRIRQWTVTPLARVCVDDGARRSMIIGIPNCGRSVMSAQGSTVCPGTR